MGCNVYPRIIAEQEEEEGFLQLATWRVFRKNSRMGVVVADAMCDSNTIKHASPPPKTLPVNRVVLM